MPHPKGNVKLSGDTHLPDAESDLEVEEGSARMADLARERTQSGRRATHARKAGVLTAGDDAGAIGAVSTSADPRDDAGQAATARPELQRQQLQRQSQARGAQPAAPAGRAFAVRPMQAPPLALLGAGALALLLVRKILR